MSEPAAEEARFRRVFRGLHADHPPCLADEWLGQACRDASGESVAFPIAWSRRNGPWRRVEVLWVGAAPGNAGGRGSGDLGAHATRIPFGGDVGGANLDAMLGTIGLDRNQTFICSASNRLPAAGGGEPTRAELLAPVGSYPNAIAALGDTLIACGPRLVVALGNVALRAIAATTHADARLPTADRLAGLGAERGRPLGLEAIGDGAGPLAAAWRNAWGGSPLPAVLWLTHPSAQNMSPYAATHTGFHQRMLDAQRALREAAREVLGRAAPSERPFPATDGIYDLPEWRERVGPRHADLDRRWREKGV